VRNLPEYGRLTGQGIPCGRRPTSCIRWLALVLCPRHVPESLRDGTRKFYKLFYHVDLIEPQLDGLLASATAPGLQGECLKPGDTPFAAAGPHLGRPRTCTSRS